MNRELANAWGEFLGQFPWTWFLTLTFSAKAADGVTERARVATPFRAHKLFETFAREIERSVGVPIGWFRADEYGPQGGRLHLHALMTGTENEHRLTWMRRWEQLAGYARIVSFDPTRGAASYCAKYVTKQFGDWAISPNLSASLEGRSATQESFWPTPRLPRRRQQDSPSFSGPSYPRNRNTVEDRAIGALDAKRQPVTSLVGGLFRHEN